MSGSKLFTYIEAMFAVIVWGASFIVTKVVKDDSGLPAYTIHRSYAYTTEHTDSQTSQNPITFNCRLGISDKKRKAGQRSWFTKTDPSWQYVKKTLREILETLL